MAVNTTQGIVLAVFGASAGGHLSALDEIATTQGGAALASTLSATAGLILGVDLSDDAAFTARVLSNLGIEEGTDGYTLASNYFTSNLAAGGDRGALVSAGVEYLLGDSVDASLTTAAATFTTTVTDAVAYSQGEGATVFGVAELIAQQGGGEPAGPAGASFVLTTSADDLDGDADDNTFTADLLTVNDNDNLAGGDGNDTLSAEINGAVSDKFVTTSIESVRLTSFGANSVDMKNMSGVTELTTTGSTGAVTLNNVSSASMALGFEGTNTNSITANYVAGTLSGSADALTVNLTGATSAVVDADAGYESVAVTATGTSGITTLTVPGVDSATLTATDGTLTMADGTLSNVTTVIATGAGDIKVGTMSGIQTITATGMTGGLKTAATVSSTGLANDTITGVAAGSSLLLGAGDDHIKFVGAASSTKSDTIRSGDGADTIEFAKGTGSIAVFGQGGNDSLYSNATTAAADVIDGGVGEDTLTNNTGNLVATVRNVENVVLRQGTTFDATNTTSAVAVTANAGTTTTHTDVDVQALASGSTVSITADSAATTGGAQAITVGFAATEAASTIAVATKVTSAEATDDVKLVKITDATINFTDTVDLSTNSAGLIVDDTTSLTISSAKAINLGAGIVSATTDKLASFTITGSKDVTTGAIENSDKLTAVTASTSDGAVNVGALAGAKALDTVSVTATTGATLGAIGGTTVADAISSVTVTGGTTATVGATAAKALTAQSVTATKGKLDHDGMTISDSNAGVLGDVTLTATDGELEVEAIDSDKTMGTITLTSTNGAIDGEVAGTDATVSAADTTGITVNMSAKTFIGDDGTTTAAILVENTKGDITASVGGAAAAGINYTAGGGAASTAGVVNLTATNTGGLATTITNGAVAKDGDTSSITLGNAASGKTNAVTLSGTADQINLTGGSGTDTVAFTGTNSYLTGSLSGGGGTDTINFSLFDVTGDNNSTHTGLVVNLGSTEKTFEESSSSNNTSIASGAVKQFDDNGTKKVDAKGSSFTLSNFEKVVGTYANDYIIANNTGTTIEGNDGTDTIVLGAGADTVIFNGSGLITSRAQLDTVESFTSGDVMQFGSTFLGGIGFNSGDYSAVGSGTNNGLSANDADIVLVSDNLTGASGSAAIATLVGGTSGFSVAGSQEAVIVADDGSNAYVWYVDDALDGTETDVTSGDIVLIGKLEGTDVSAFTAANFGAAV